MQEFDGISLIKEIVKETQVISDIINAEVKLEKESLSKLDFFYEKRAEKLIQIQNWLEMGGFQKLDNDCQLEWNSIYKELLRLENSNMDTLKFKLDKTAEELRNLTKHKALLIYKQE